MLLHPDYRDLEGLFLLDSRFEINACPAVETLHNLIILRTKCFSAHDLLSNLTFAPHTDLSTQAAVEPMMLPALADITEL